MRSQLSPSTARRYPLTLVCQVLRIPRSSVYAAQAPAVPLGELGIEVVDRAEGPGREEGVAQVLDHPLHAAFFIAAGHGAGLRGEVVVAGELEQPRVEADVLAVAFEDDAFQVVVQEHSRHAPQGGEGLDVAAEKALERLVEGEARVDGAGPGEHEHEARQHAAGTTDLEGAEVPPVDLALLRGEGVEPEVGLGPGGGPDGPHVAADLDDGAGVASLAQHGPETRGAQAGVLLEGRGDERLVGIQPAGPDLGAGMDPAIAVKAELTCPAVDGSADGLVVDPEGVGDGADRPVLGVEEAADLGALEQGDHARASPPQRRPGTAMGQGDVADPPARSATAGTARSRSTNPTPSLGIDGILLASRRRCQGRIDLSRKHRSQMSPVHRRRCPVGCHAGAAASSASTGLGLRPSSPAFFFSRSR